MYTHTHTQPHHKVQYTLHRGLLFYIIKRWRRVQLLLYYYKTRGPYSLMAVANTHHHVIVRAYINPSTRYTGIHDTVGA